MVTNLPVVGITLGDVAGIGPEVVVKALKHPEIYASCHPLVIGDARVFADPRFAAQHPQVWAVSDIVTAHFAPEALTVLDLQNLNPDEVTPGQLNVHSGRAAVEYVITAAELAQWGVLDAVATAPLNKAAIRLAGYEYLGHTEILADVTRCSRCTTMLATQGLRVTHVTRHVPFREIAAHLTVDSVLETIVLTDEGLRQLGYPAPRMAVAALNPHGGEGGLLGREELEVIAPAVAAAQAQGLAVVGPLPADSVFVAALRGDYDVVVCMYHDQGHIAVKTHGFDDSITITLGLPIVRTSADHGTAFDIAGQGVAHEGSMVAAILAAAQLARQKVGTARKT